MHRIFWDASALAKRYYSENGTEVVNALFALVPASLMATTLLGVAETYSILCRKHNNKDLGDVDFTLASLSLRREITASPGVSFLTIEDTDILRSLTYIVRHNINATDAILLTILLRERAVGIPYTLVASDVRLIRASAAEGIGCLNPETTAPSDVPALLASQ